MKLSKRVLFCLVLVVVALLAQTDAPGPLSILPLPDHSAVNPLRLWDKTQGHYVGLKAPATVAANLLWSIPGVDGAAGQVWGWTSAGTIGWVTASAAPFTDANAILFNAADATKLLKFSLTPFATATTNTLTVQNASYTIAGTNISNTFSAANTFSQTNTFSVDQNFSGNVLLNGSVVLTNSGTSTINFSGVTAGHNQFIKFDTGTNGLVFQDITGTLHMELGGTLGNTSYHSFFPNVTNTRDLGSNALQWANVFGTTFNAAGSAGVSCSGTPTASFASVGGIVTHC